MFEHVTQPFFAESAVKEFNTISKESFAHTYIAKFPRFTRTPDPKKVFDSLKATVSLYNGPVWLTLLLKKKKRKFLSWKYIPCTPGWGICCTHTFRFPFARICFSHCTVGNNELPLKLIIPIIKVYHCIYPFHFWSLCYLSRAANMFVRTGYYGERTLLLNVGWNLKK